MNRFKNYIISLLVTIIVVVGLTYTAYGLTDIYPKDTSTKEILASGGFATLVGWLVAILLCELAIAIFTIGEEISDAKTVKSEILTKVTPNLGKGHRFCEVRNEQEYNLRKEAIIRKYFIDVKAYEEYIKNGGLKNKELSFFTKISLWRMERKIKKAHYDTFNFSEVVNGTTQPELKRKKRVTLSGYRSKTYSKKILSSLATGLIFGYFGLKLAEEPNWGMVIYLAIQFTSFIASGMVQFLFTRSYILNDFKAQILEDANFLHEFEGSLIQHPEWYIEKTKEVNQEIKEKVIEEISIPIINNVVSLDTVNQPLD